MIAQKTLCQAIEVSGVGIFTGAMASVKICPAPVDTGLYFQRTDLEGSSPIPAHVDFVLDSLRCTRLGVGSASVMMVEHLLSALYAYGIENARIEVTGPEIPGLDGSSLRYIELIEQVGVVSQEKESLPLVVQEPIFYSKGDLHLVALPSSGFKVSYTMHDPRSSLLGSQYYTMDVAPSKYRNEIAPCRTFSLYREILPFIEKGLIRGGGLENALVIDGDKILNPEGARFPDEMVRHKVLDLIGDLSLVGRPLQAHVIAICSGHASNVAFAKMISSILQRKEFECLVVPLC